MRVLALFLKILFLSEINSKFVLILVKQKILIEFGIASFFYLKIFFKCVGRLGGFRA